METATGTAPEPSPLPPPPLRGDWLDLFAEWYDDPLAYFEVALQAKELRKWQRSILAEIRDRRRAGELHTRVHVRTNHGSGKTYLAGGLCNWWQTTRPGARTFTTAPTWDLLETRLWVEIRKHYQNSLSETRFGELMPRSARWYTGGGANPDWFAMGGSSDRPANLEGFHSWAIARIIDEAKAVPDAVYTATDGMFFPCDESFDLWISTPSTRMGRFYERDVADDATLLRKVVSIEDLIADGMPGAVEGKKRFILDYGGEHTFEYRSRAMAEYIDNSEGALFPFSWIERAMFTDEQRIKSGLTTFHVGGNATLGYDVAGSIDGDENAVAAVHGPDSEMRYEVKAKIDHWHERDTMKSRDRILETMRARNARCVRVDVQGLGKGVSDAIREKVADQHLSWWVEEYRSADPAGSAAMPDTTDPANPKNRFLNKKAENAWNVRVMLEQDRLRLPFDAELRRDMAAMKYEVHNGKIRVIDPPDSPDLWDAVLMAIGGVYHSVSLDDIGGGGINAWGPDEKHLGWTSGLQGL